MALEGLSWPGWMVGVQAGTNQVRKGQEHTGARVLQGRTRGGLPGGVVSVGEPQGDRIAEDLSGKLKS